MAAALYVLPTSLGMEYVRVILENYVEVILNYVAVIRYPRGSKKVPVTSPFKLRARKRLGKKAYEREREVPSPQIPLKNPWKEVFIKSPSNPIIRPNPDNRWEAYQTFNPGAIILGGRIHIVYRALGVDWISRFGYASSSDGVAIDERLPHPIYQSSVDANVFSVSISGGGFGGCEDPRLVAIDDVIYMTYNIFDSKGLRVGLTSIRVEDFLGKSWRWSEERVISNPGKINKNFVLFPERIDGRYAILHSISPRVQIAYLDDLRFDGYIESHYEACSYPGGWELVVKGAGGPPIKTSEGWLLFYHGLGKNDPWKYKIGLMLLDLDRPERILYRARSPVIEADQWYEYEGFKPGITYTCGAVLRGGELLVFYGAADKYVCMASAPLDLILDTLKRYGAHPG